MKPMFARTLALTTAALAVTACAVQIALPTPPDVAQALRAPIGQEAYLEALAVGVQIYDCTAKADAAGAFEWKFRAPEATLADRAGKSLGKHFAGPTWESVDGSTVVGAVKAKDAGPVATAIPWLLLDAKSNTGTGAFASTKSIQRVNTVGGTAPADGCNAANMKKEVRVPYTATYYFYRAAK